MRKHTIAGVIVFGIIASYPFIAYAQFSAFSRRPFGGQVISTAVPAVICAAQYTTLIRPVGSVPGGISFIRATQKVVRPGSWTLGWISTIQDMTTCKTTAVPPVPVPAFEIKYQNCPTTNKWNDPNSPANNFSSAAALQLALLRLYLLFKPIGFARF